MFNTITNNDLDLFFKKYEQRSISNNISIEEKVRKIISDVIVNKDVAVKRYNSLFDNSDTPDLKVTQLEFDEAFTLVDNEIIEILKEAIVNIRDYHKRQLIVSDVYTKEKGITLGRIVTPIERVGIYAPGGLAVYQSTVLMNVVPAVVAGCSEIVMVTPPNKDGKINPLLLVAAVLAGATEVYKVGGAQAIAALAYGTESIKKVDKITGPGNIYVACAKKMVSGVCGIDMIAGPSEILIIADETANPKFVAADMMAQSEHDLLASAVLVTTSTKLIEDVKKEINNQITDLSKKDIILKSLEQYGFAILVDNIKEAFDLSNRIAPEHLEIITKNKNDYKLVKNAGAIFLGEYSPEVLGDYFAGCNHTLPTNQTARFSSALGIDDFIKKTSFMSYTKNAFNEVCDKIDKFATSEFLTAHANACKVRKG